MARTTGPLLSMDASGSVGNSITFAKWKGRNYVRRYAVPANPRSIAQTSIRTAMKYYTALWKEYTAQLEADYIESAQSQKISPFNAWTRAGMKNWKSSIVLNQNNLECPFGATGTNLNLSGVAQPRGITWTFGAAAGPTPDAFILSVREAADPGVSTQFAVYAAVDGGTWLQTGLKGATVYQARVTAVYDDGTTITRNAAVSVTTS